MTNGKPPQKTVVDFSDGHYKFGYDGTTVRTAIFEKIQRLEREELDLLNQIERELGTDMKLVAGLIVALHSDSLNSKAQWIQSLCKNVVKMQDERTSLSRIYTGMNSGIIYTLGPIELERFGL